MSPEPPALPPGFARPADRLGAAAGGEGEVPRVDAGPARLCRGPGGLRGQSWGWPDLARQSAIPEGMGIREVGMAARADGMAARAEGMPSWGAGMSPRVKGMALRAKGMAARAKGIAARAKGIASRTKGMASQPKGMAVRELGMRTPASWSVRATPWSGERLEVGHLRVIPGHAVVAFWQGRCWAGW